MIFEPILGLGVGCKFIKAAQTAGERRARVATLAALLSASTGAAVGSNPATNAGLGAALASHIVHMRNILQIRGGQIENPRFEINPYRAQFTYNSKMIIDNMFQEHTARRYLQGSVNKIVQPSYSVPIASTQIKTTALIGWTCFGVGLIGFITLATLYLFQRAKRKRWQNQYDGVVIDVTASLSQ